MLQISRRWDSDDVIVSDVKDLKPFVCKLQRPFTTVAYA